VRGARLSPAGRGTFGALLLIALLLAGAELIAWALTGLGCIGGVAVACYGPNNGNPAAPGYWFGNVLAGGAGAISGLVAVVSFLGLVGVRVVRRTSVLRAGALLLVAAGIASIWAEVVLRESPSAVYCAKVNDGGGCAND
jgi:hypothetical protein